MSGPASDLAAVIAELAERLPAGHLAAWARVLRTIPADDLAASARALEATLIDARPGVALGGAAGRLIAAWQAAVPPLSGAAVALALESAGQVADRAADDDVAAPCGSPHGDLSGRFQCEGNGSAGQRWDSRLPRGDQPPSRPA